MQSYQLSDPLDSFEELLPRVDHIEAWLMESQLHGYGLIVDDAISAEHLLERPHFLT